MEGGFRKQEGVVGILAFEVAYVMSKLVPLWDSLSFEQVERDRKFLPNSVGFKKLVHMMPISSEDFEHAVCDWIDNGVDAFGWKLSSEEMGKEAKKMKSFVSVTGDLYHQMKLVSHLEGTRNRMDGPNWLEIQHKIELKQLEVDKLKEESLWNMTFNYIGIILARSVFTIFTRIKSVYGVPQLNADRSH
ncbi:PREDICTED: uncharacterized protein LOC101311141 [Fragaria vesca subsp. vesca]